MAKVETEEVTPGFRKIQIPPYKVGVLPIPNRYERALTPMISTSGQAQIIMPNRGIITIDPDGTTHIQDKDVKPILDFDSIKTGILHADQVLTVGDSAGWRVEISGVTATYPIRYWDGVTSKFSIDKNGNVVLSGSLIASEIHIPSVAAGANSFHVDVTGNVWWNSALLAGANHYVKKDGTAKFKSITLETNVIIKDLQGGSVIAGTYIDELEANKIVAGTGIINALSVKNVLTLGNASNDGVIASYNWDDSVPGFYLSGGATPIFKIIGGVIVAGTIATALTNQRIELNTAGYENSIAFWNSDNALCAKISGYVLSGNPWLSVEGNIFLAGYSLRAANDIQATRIYIGPLLTASYFETNLSSDIISNRTLAPETNDLQALGSTTLNWRSLYLSDFSSYGIYFGSTKRIYMVDASSVKIEGNLHIGTGSIDILNQAAFLAWGGEACLGVPITGGISSVIVYKDFVPNTTSSKSLGYTDKRWSNIWGDNIYCTNQTADQHITGDLHFKDLFRIDETKKFLRFFNKDDKLIMKLSQDGRLWIKKGISLF